MADVCDMAGEFDGMDVAGGLTKLRDGQALAALKPRTSIHCDNGCGEKCKGRFCSAECRDDFEFRERQRKRQKV